MNVIEAVMRDLGWGGYIDAPDEHDARRADLASKAALVRAIGGDR